MTEHLRDDEQEWQRLASEATSGPWHPRWGGEPGYVYAGLAGSVVALCELEMSDSYPRPNSTFIAAARTAVPELLRRLETERQQVAIYKHREQSMHQSLSELRGKVIALIGDVNMDRAGMYDKHYRALCEIDGDLSNEITVIWCGQDEGEPQPAASQEGGE